MNTDWLQIKPPCHAILQIELDVLPGFNCSTGDPRLGNGMIREGRGSQFVGLTVEEGGVVRVLMQAVRVRKEYRPGVSRWLESMLSADVASGAG